ncbi:glycosyltransferase family 2 protein, partial [Mailhella sp.]|uniref:glycosyltransferase family 2 protein n=1 Tax=Mailhella sp. TaxID=1981029 RepID=UPI003AB3B8F8
MPRISVLMPVYNTRPEHLREAMDSILSQTFTDFEFLILNDCSTDPQVETVVKSYTDPRIVYAVNERNLGISGARNRLLDMAQGEYLAVMDHDDIALPTRFEKQVAFLDAHPEIGIVGSRVDNMGTGKTEPRPA